MDTPFKNGIATPQGEDPVLDAETSSRPRWKSLSSFTTKLAVNRTTDFPLPGPSNGIEMSEQLFPLSAETPANEMRIIDKAIPPLPESLFPRTYRDMVTLFQLVEQKQVLTFWFQDICLQS